MISLVDDDRSLRGGDWRGPRGCGRGRKLELQCGSSPNGPASFAWWAWLMEPPNLLFLFLFPQSNAQSR